jgi:CheY-like chemotaxis protein
VVLRRLGLEVHAAATADEALALLKRVRPDVIVSDIGMPGTDGYQFMRKVRSLSDEQGGRTPGGGSDGVRAQRGPDEGAAGGAPGASGEAGGRE